MRPANPTRMFLLSAPISADLGRRKVFDCSPMGGTILALVRTSSHQPGTRRTISVGHGLTYPRMTAAAWAEHKPTACLLDLENPAVRAFRETLQ